MEYIQNANGTDKLKVLPYKQNRLTPGLTGWSIKHLGDASSGVRDRLVANVIEKPGQS